MTDLEFINSLGWDYKGLLYRENGDGFGHFRHKGGRRMRVGAREMGWDGKSSLKKAAIAALAARFRDGEKA